MPARRSRLWSSGAERSNSGRGLETMCASRCVVTTFCVCFVAMATVGSPDDILPTELKEQATLLVELSSSTEPRPVSVEFLHAVSESDLQRLEAHAHRSVAIAAAWERVRRVLPRDSVDDTSPNSRYAVYRFAGFLEGRLRVRVPQPWLEAILTASVTSQDRTVFLSTPDELMSEHHLVNEVQMPVSTTVTDRGGGMSVRLGSRNQNYLPSSSWRWDGVIGQRWPNRFFSPIRALSRCTHTWPFHTRYTASAPKTEVSNGHVTSGPLIENYITRGRQRFIESGFWRRSRRWSYLASLLMQPTSRSSP